MKSSGPLRRLMHYTPLRYPGGKGKLAPYIKQLMRDNRLVDGEYAEPYAGGAAVAMELMLQEYASRVHINDLNRPVFSFWHCVLNDADKLCKLVRDTPLSIRTWDKQKKIFANPNDADNLSLGFATFYLNRTNRSGILNGGIIGGRDQTGEWKIDARFNRAELIYRIESIAKMASKVSLTQMDALDFLKQGAATWPEKTLIYLDPPYYKKGRDLYYDFYESSDHAKLKKFVTSKLSKRNWVVSYDNVAEIRALYKECPQIIYRLGYSARSASEGAEAMFFSQTMNVGRLVGPFRLIRTRLAA